MKFLSLKKGIVKARRNRFVVEALDEAARPLFLHLPNSGRLMELIIPGREVWYESFEDISNKKTIGKLSLIKNERGDLVCIDANLPNALVHEALLEGRFTHFSGFQNIKREYTIGNSRFDLYLSGSAGQCLIEVKSVTLVEAKVAMFPDAPTIRGLKHLEELRRLCKEGFQTAVVFVIQREDAGCFTPNYRTHREFGEKLQEVSKQGVKVLAWDCLVSLNEIKINKPLAVKYEGEV